MLRHHLLSIRRLRTRCVPDTTTNIGGRYLASSSAPATAPERRRQTDNSPGSESRGAASPHHSRGERRRLHEERQEKAHRAREQRKQKNIDQQQVAQRKAQERQRLHQAKVDEARNLKEEAHRRHREIQETSQENTQEKLRKNAARSIPYWLGKNPECLELTMGALNVELGDSQNNNNKSSPSSIETEYKQMYLDSIPSFFLKLTDSTLSPEVQSSLDMLVEAGFSDLNFAKKHRTQLDRERKQESYVGVMQGKQRKLVSRKAILQQERLKFEELQADRKQKMGVENEEKEKADESFLNRAASMAASFFGSGKPKSDHTVTAAVDDMTVSLEGDAELEKQWQAVKQAEIAVQKTENQMEYLKEKNKSREPLLSDDAYALANKTMQEVLQKTICPALASHVHERHARMIEQYQTLDANTDLTKPHEWYTHARLDQRKIIFHGGPTNSGKTYTALERLREAKNGLYLGPLRLLAGEVYETLTSKGVYTNLYTGQEKREIAFSTHSAATVEMAPTTEDFDVVVIDEIQMIADEFRGFAWTRALMGIRCKEIHVCGGLEAKDIVERIAGDCGDVFELREYERFSALNVAERSLAPNPGVSGSYRQVQSGDCVVAFSRNDIFAIKREIESSTKHKCCIIYGSLPPETRTKQAQLFNDPDSGYDVLVASDAIGMGLNLNIRRIIFNSIYKSNGENIVRLDHSAVKQIAGRAGRRNSPFPEGEVTCRDPDDMQHLVECMSKEITPISKAGLLPTSTHVSLFYETLEKFEMGKELDELHTILEQFSEMATVKGDFFLCRQTPMRIIAKWLTEADLPLDEKFTMCLGPVNTSSPKSLQIIQKFATKRALGSTAGLSRVKIPKRTKAFEDLSYLCSLHSELELFLWLYNRFPPGNVVEQQTALALKERVIEIINKSLGKAESLKLEHCYISRDRRLRETWMRMERADKELVGEYLEGNEVDDDV